MRQMIVALVAALGVASAGCAGAIHDASSNAATSALDAVTTSESMRKWDALSASAAAAARDKALDAETTAKTTALVAAVDARLRDDLLGTRDAALGPGLHLEIASLRADLLGAVTRAAAARLVGEALAPAIPEATRFREELVGSAAQKDLDALIDGAAPHLAAALNTALGPAKAAADAEASKYKLVALGLGLGAMALLIALGVTFHVLRTHRLLISKLLERG